MAKYPGVPSYVPAQYDYWISDASKATGLPAAVVAAQIQDESGFNPDAQSSAGALGFAQFLPSTYYSEGGHGSQFIAKNELIPYENLTNADLKWSGGNVEQALAAYNAGQGNWQAGIGYADTILTNANEPTNMQSVPGDKNVSGGGGSSSNSSSNPTGGGFSIFNPLTWISTDTWERFGLILFGALLILVGVFMLAGKQTIKIATTAAESGVV